MPYIDKIQIGSTSYDIKDSTGEGGSTTSLPYYIFSEVDDLDDFGLGVIVVYSGTENYIDAEGTNEYELISGDIINVENWPQICIGYNLENPSIYAIFYNIVANGIFNYEIKQATPPGTTAGERLVYNGSAWDLTIPPYAVCPTTAATAAKTVAITNWKLIEGNDVYIKFTYVNTAASPTLNVNYTGPKSMYYNGAVITSSNFTFDTTTIYHFVWDGSYFVLVGSSKKGLGLGTAATKAYTDSTTASAIGTGTDLTTERDIYYGLPTINGVHTYNSSTNYYVPTTAGTTDQVLISNGSGAPSWRGERVVASTATPDSNCLIWIDIS